MLKLLLLIREKHKVARLADLHLQITPGTDIYLYNAIARVLIENGDVDFDFISKHTEEFEKYKRFCFSIYR